MSRPPTRRDTRRRPSPAARAEEVLAQLRSMADPTRLAGMARYGIATEDALGVTVTELRRFARGIGRDHDLALALWRTGVHEARILATIVDDPRFASLEQLDAWIADIRSWDLCDAVCGNLADRTPFAAALPEDWTRREPEFEKRAGFSVMATSAVHRREWDDRPFRTFLGLVCERADDERNAVRKGVSWALRQIGKRNDQLHAEAVEVAGSLAARSNPGARWAGRDALRELTSEAVLGRFGRTGPS